MTLRTCRHEVRNKLATSLLRRCNGICEATPTTQETQRTFVTFALSTVPARLRLLTNQTAAKNVT